MILSLVELFPPVLMITVSVPELPEFVMSVSPDDFKRPVALPVTVPVTLPEKPEVASTVPFTLSMFVEDGVVPIPT